MGKNNKLTRPDWIRAKVTPDHEFSGVKELLRAKKLNSVCVEAACPNKGECWPKRHATFMVLGDTCTRNCSFCNVKKGIPLNVDREEPLRLSEAVKELGIRYAVITSVTRDDLKDRGAGHFAEVVRELKTMAPDILVELLIPDMRADEELLEIVALSGADVIGHNIEMPRRLYCEVRPGSDYDISLGALKILSALSADGERFKVKSAMMVGVGETDGEITETLRDLKACGTDIVYIGQYLNPSQAHHPVRKYYTPDEFDSLKRQASAMGFAAVQSGPLVRSSYRAEESYLSLLK